MNFGSLPNTKETDEFEEVSGNVSKEEKATVRENILKVYELWKVTWTQLVNVSTTM